MSKQKAKLEEMLKNRNPLLETKREAVKPVDLYTKPQVGKPTSGQVDKTTKPQVVKTTSKQVGKKIKPQVVKYTTHLKPETIKELKRYAFERELKDYEVVKDAIEGFLKRVKGDTPL